MRKTRLVLLVTSVFLVLAAVKGVGALPEQEIIQTVRYACIVSPDMRGHIEGEWMTDCNGNTTGWGWEPGHNCTYTDTTYGNTCPAGGGGEPGGGGRPRR